MPEGQFGRYQLLEEIGRGGFATVYKARDTRLNRTVAVKVLNGNYSNAPNVAQRFQYEAETVAALKHPNIITIYDVTKIERQPAIVMEYLPNGNLKEWLEHNKPPLALTKALSFLEPLAKAIDYAHQNGLIHRDIKPSNVMLEKTNDGFRVVLTDFGLVKAIESDSIYTRTGVTLGSPEYMSPEQADHERQDEISFASDLYALGVLAYLLLVGRLPYAGKSRAVLLGHTDGKIPFPQSYNSSLTSSLSSVLIKILSKRPSRRHATALSFVEALKRKEPLAVPSSPLRQPRNGLLIIALFAFVGLGLWGFSSFRDGGGSGPTRAVVMVDNEATETAVAANNTPTTTMEPTTATPTLVNTPTTTPTALPSLTPTISPSPTATADPNFPPTIASLGDTWTRPTDGMVMVFVPAGNFMMGSDPEDDPNAQDDEFPAHEVQLSSFWLDQTEVTNAQFAQFVAETNYVTTAEEEGSGLILSEDGTRFEDTEGADWQHPNGPDSNLNGLGNHPVVLVSWEDANAYCEWAGGKLPTEAEWEYAARGPEATLYPWGNEFDNSLLNFCDSNCQFSWQDDTADDGYEQTAPVGSYPNGASWVDAHDLAGNVWEWVADWYLADFYNGPNGVIVDPVGPEDGERKVLRGGGWNGNHVLTRSANRNNDTPTLRVNNVGFRCAAPGT